MTPVDEAVAKLYELEDKVTKRRLIEAVLGIDNGWLASMHVQMEAQRAIINGQENDI